MHVPGIFTFYENSDTIPIMQVLPILEMINPEAESDSNLGIPSSTPRYRL